MGVPVRPGTPSHRTGPAGPGRDGRLAPGRSRCERGDMAGAMAPAISAVKLLSPHVRAGSGNAARFPRPRGTVPCRPAGPGTTQASARPGGCKAPAGGGAGAGRGLWPPAGPDPGAALWQGRWPLPFKRGVLESTGPALWAGTGNASRFPRPCGTVPCRPAGPGTPAGQRPARRGRSARRGRGGRWPGALVPGGPVPCPAQDRGDDPGQTSGGY